MNSCFLCEINTARPKAECISARQRLASRDVFCLRNQHYQPGTAPEGELDEE